MYTRKARIAVRNLLFTVGVFAGLVLFASTAAAQVVTTLVASRDNTLIQNNTGAVSNGAGDHMFAGRVGGTGGTSIRRGLLSFDVAGGIPAGSTITSVRLTLNMSRSIIAGEQTIQLRRVLGDWGEGTSNAGGEEGQGAQSTANDATWVHRFFNTANWQTQGGDFAATASASLAVGGDGRYTWGSSAQMVADVQGWFNNPGTNFGWLLLGNEASAGTAKRFDTRENPTAANRPMLEITYTPIPEPGSILLGLFGMGCLSLVGYRRRRQGQIA
jgi:hypothetical protein